SSRPVHATIAGSVTGAFGSGRQEPSYAYALRPHATACLPVQAKRYRPAGGGASRCQTLRRGSYAAKACSPSTRSSRPVQTLVRSTCAAIGASGSSFQVPASGAASAARPLYALRPTARSFTAVPSTEKRTAETVGNCVSV